jgi:phosphate transport system permease protein
VTAAPHAGPTGLEAARGSRRGDSGFRWVTLLAAALVLVLLAAIAAFLVIRSIPALQQDTASFFSTKTWDPDGTKVFGVAALVFGTVLSSVLALLMAVPAAIGVALFITEYAPRRIAAPLGYVVDLVAAIPSVVFGLWGVYFLLPRMVGLQKFLADHFGWIPLFHDPNNRAAQFSQSMFGASVVLAIMILPIVAAISREVFRQVDPGHKEAALALGATKWETIRTAVLPPSRGGVMGGVMLGLGRALGETIAVALVLSSSYQIKWHILEPGGNTIAANIANRFAESGALGRSALIASGVVLFVLTLAVNLIARWVIHRSGTRERSAV